jgi:hypothetical protein
MAPTGSNYTNGDQSAGDGSTPDFVDQKQIEEVKKNIESLQSKDRKKKYIGLEN